jgi:hypothetical protein
VKIKFVPHSFVLDSTTMSTDADISSISWTEESFENQSDTDTNSTTIDNKIKEKLPTFK